MTKPTIKLIAIRKSVKGAPAENEVIDRRIETIVKISKKKSSLELNLLLKSNDESDLQEMFNSLEF